MTTLLLVRHARAMPPGDRRLPGPDVALVPAGVAQARTLANRLHDLAPDVVYTSDAKRARQTGEIIAGICGVPSQPIPELRELDFGAWAGLTYAEAVAADPAASAWFDRPDIATPSGGESIAAAADRVLGVLQTIAADDAARVVVVGHAGSLRLAVAQALGMPLASYWRLRLDCASLSNVIWSGDALLVEGWNDTAHLEPEAEGSDGPTPDLDARP